jgi:hypothetical protein
VRMGVAAVAERWLRARRAMRKEDQAYAEELAAMAKRHASEGFYAFDDPLEAALFSVLVELLKERDREQDPERDRGRDDADP